MSTEKLPAISYPTLKDLWLYWDLGELAPRHLHLFLLHLTVCAESVLTGVPLGQWIISPLPNPLEDHHQILVREMNHLLFDIAEKLQVWQLHTFVGDGRLRIPATGGPLGDFLGPVSTSVFLPTELPHLNELPYYTNSLLSSNSYLERAEGTTIAHLIILALEISDDDKLGRGWMINNAGWDYRRHQLDVYVFRSSFLRASAPEHSSFRPLQLSSIVITLGEGLRRVYRFREPLVCEG